MDRSVALLDRQQKVSGERRMPLTRGWSATYSEPADVPRVGRLESASGHLVRLWGRRGSLESFATMATARYRLNRVRRRGSPSLQNHSSTARRKLYKFVLATGSLQRHQNCRCPIQERKQVNYTFVAYDWRRCLNTSLLSVKNNFFTYRVLKITIFFGKINRLGIDTIKRG